MCSGLGSSLILGTETYFCQKEPKCSQTLSTLMRTPGKHLLLRHILVKWFGAVVEIPIYFIANKDLTPLT